MECLVKSAILLPQPQRRRRLSKEVERLRRTKEREKEKLVVLRIVGKGEQKERAQHR